jgi:adenosylcobinamide kinase / adenosylcobinamide-phosphate guanylyltransferase
LSDGRRTTGPVLVLGGVRSGKTAFAEGLALGSGLQPVYLATASAGDEEMARRIEAHRRARPEGWTTIEEPLDLLPVLGREAAPTRILLVDCLTLWITNLMVAGLDVEDRASAFLRTAQTWRGPVILVSNEVGLGGIAGDAMSRRFADHAGQLHQGLAKIASEVILVAAGLPVWLKR